MSEDMEKVLESLLGEVEEEKPKKKEEKKEVVVVEEKSKKEEKKEEIVIEKPKPKPKPKPKKEEKPFKKASELISKEKIEEVKAKTKEKIIKKTNKIPEEIIVGEEKVEAEIPSKWDFSEEVVPTKIVVLIYGDKGTGKTTTAMSFPGEIAVLSFDKKAAIIKEKMFNGDKRIHVFDAIKYMDYSSPKTVVASADVTFQYIQALLDYIAKKIKPNWIVIDGAEIFEAICEWTMRYRNKLEAFQGISNLNLWKERRLYIKQIHYKALEVAKRGIIYTTYCTYDEIIVQGDVVNKKKVPKWIDVLVTETDFVLMTQVDDMNDRFLVKVVSSKDDSFMKTGKLYDVTGETLWQKLRK